MESTKFDIAIIGGGMAGLSLSILLAKASISVILFEKDTYPFHKVCGEFISSESIPFLKSLGVDFEQFKLPEISLLRLTSNSGVSIERPLDIGGTGISRYKLDEILYELAIKAGVSVKTNTKINQVHFIENQFELSDMNSNYEATLVIGAYGKNSNIDAQLNRSIKIKNDNKLFIAVKHHVYCAYDKRYVEIHNFDGGYCGMSAIEDDKVNLSYICKASQLKKAGSISELEKKILSVNPFLRTYFSEGEFIFSKPLTISHLHFGIKSPVTNHILMLGDAAGNIAPLSGNGMSMALRSSKIASSLIINFLNGQITREELELHYAYEYNKVFHNRVLAARIIHQTFGHKYITNISISVLKQFPFLLDIASKQIHGDTF